MTTEDANLITLAEIKSAAEKLELMIKGSPKELSSHSTYFMNQAHVYITAALTEATSEN